MTPRAKGRMRLATATLVLLALAGAASAQPPGGLPATEGPHASSFAGPRQAYVMLIRLRQDLWLRYRQSGAWPDDAEANAALEGHVAYWRKQLAAGAALIAGGMEGDYWDNASIIVFEASSQEAAHAIVDADPAVQAFVFQAQLRPFTLFWMTDRFEGAD